MYPYPSPLHKLLELLIPERLIELGEFPALPHFLGHQRIDPRPGQTLKDVAQEGRKIASEHQLYGYSARQLEGPQAVYQTVHESGDIIARSVLRQVVNDIHEIGSSTNLLPGLRKLIAAHKLHGLSEPGIEDIVSGG